tara:strand:+ start:150 stop:431 length:282 start_codon:yes stop_codon:yes gene_type:complete
MISSDSRIPVDPAITTGNVAGKEIIGASNSLARAGTEIALYKAEIDDRAITPETTIPSTFIRNKSTLNTTAAIKTIMTDTTVNITTPDNHLEM